MGAVCVGAFLLAEAGLLNDRRATTHWKFGSEMATRYPDVRVEHDPLWVKDGNIYTSAGISAGIDLALRGWKRIAEQDSHTKRRANWCCFCDAPVDNRKSASRWPRRPRR